jgi:hypothetical protein
MNLRLRWTIGLWISVSPLLAQTSTWQLRVQRLGSLRYNDVADAGWNGWALQAERSQIGANRLGWLAGAEAGYTGWGNQLLAKGGIQYALVQSTRITGTARLYAMPGIALFRPRSLFTYRAGAEVVVGYSLGKRMGLMAAAGLAYSACPAYKQYGAISRYLDVPLSVGIQWQRRQ